MHFALQTYQTAFWVLLGVFVCLLAAALIVAVSFVSRVLSARMENTTVTLRGRMDGGVPPIETLRRHKRLAFIALGLVALLFLVMLGVLRDGRMNVVNDDEADVLTVNGQIEAIEPRTLLDGTVLFFAEDGPTFGVRLTVDGTAYHVLSAGELAVGDMVTLQYLPRSRCVLYLGDGSSLPHPAVTPQESIAAEEAALAAIPPVREMTFPFEDYRRILLFEAGLCVVLAVLLLRVVIGFAVDLVRRRMTAEGGFRIAFCLVGLVVLLAVGCSSVWNGGWRLLLEEPSEAVSVQGEIGAIETLGSRDGVKFTTEWGTQFGCYITVGGERYFAMYEGDLAVGDTVELTCLPRSRYVLWIAAD